MKRALLLAAPAVLVLGLVACGDDDDDSPDTTAAETTEPEDTSTDDTTTDGTEGELTIPGISIPDISIPDISIPDFSIPDFSIPDISIPDISIPNAEEILGQIFPKLDDDQVDCLADEVGRDIDVSRIMQLLDECNIDPSDLQPGG
jgi:hypothetical protein